MIEQLKKLFTDFLGLCAGVAFIFATVAVVIFGLWILKQLWHLLFS